LFHIFSSFDFLFIVGALVLLKKIQIILAKKGVSEQIEEESRVGVN